MVDRPAIAVSMGDPAGVGPELCLRALNNGELRESCTLVVFGDPQVLKRVSAATGQALAADEIPLEEFRCGCVTAEEAVVVGCSALSEAEVQPGKISASCGIASFHYVEAAIHAALQGKVCAVVTAPIQKEAWRLAGVVYPGHTEAFTVLTGARKTCMMQMSSELTVTMVTTHVGYAEVPQLLTVQRVFDVIELTANALADMTGRAPRLGVCGLNPHAGEHGLFGQREEERIILPAIERARSGGIAVDGPLPPDAAFLPHVRKQFDAIVCMYHDPVSYT
ncbi:MAG: 4-hydroxythreonine-4-phosphate dehydrogenase PdxA, partial [Verrucomicrobiae bacterium]|nr:4-hydroxythreonine-4-phosphate dehydrogenase PdxA [Verrucomicrobiae bacterium]